MSEHVKKSLLRKVLTPSLYKYIVTGLSAFAIEYTLYLILLKGLGINYVLSSVSVYVVVFWFVFLVNRTWSFQSKGNVKHQLLKYTGLFFFNLLVANVLIMMLLTDFIGLSPVISPFIRTGLMVSWNYLIYKYFIYT